MDLVPSTVLTEKHNEIAAEFITKIIEALQKENNKVLNYYVQSSQGSWDSDMEVIELSISENQKLKISLSTKNG